MVGLMRRSKVFGGLEGGCPSMWKWTVGFAQSFGALFLAVHKSIGEGHRPTLHFRTLAEKLRGSSRTLEGGFLLRCHCSWWVMADVAAGVV